MHVGLQTFDIVDTILALIQQDYNVGRRTLQSLSLTCVSLREVALDRLWHTQPNFVALIKTMPPSHWFESSPATAGSNIGSLDFRVRNLNVTLFDRLNFYAHRIRKVLYVPHAMHQSYSIPLDIKALHSMWSLRPDPTRPILPNLQRIEFPDASHIMLDMFLACPSIDIDIGTGSTSISVAYSLQNFARNISGLHLGSPESAGPPPTSVLLEAICDMTNLRVLTTSFKLNTRVLAHLSSLPSLHKLGIPNCSQDIISSIASSSAAKFASLQDLELIEKSFATFTKLLQIIGTVQLRSLTIHSSSSLAEYELDECFSALQRARGTESLRTLHLRAAKSPNTFNSQTLRPLLSSLRLTTLQLDIDCQYYLTDSDFKDMAAAWPNMQSLQIGPLMGWSIPSPDPMTTFRSLLYLLEGCRNLERLVFTINGLVPPPVASEITPRHINRHLSIIWLGDSPIDKFCVKTVRNFLKSVLPNLVSINGRWSVTNAHGRIDTQQRLWMQVAKSEDELRSIYANASGAVNEFL